MSSTRRRRTIVPEVIQTSATDCGPASLKSVLAGMGMPLNYRALREACQTDVDGSAISTLEEVSLQLGLAAEQIMLPMDHVFLPEARALPAIIVTLTAGGRNHYVVLWSRIGPFVQVMDPATGRYWTTVRSLMSRLYQHATPVPASAWREWAGTDEAVAAFRRRQRALGATRDQERTDEALADPTYRSMAKLDAATRAVEALVEAGAVARGRLAEQLLARMIASGEQGGVDIPTSYWSVRPVHAQAQHEREHQEEEGDAVDEELLMNGAVLLRFTGWTPSTASSGAEDTRVVPAELAKALAAPQVGLARSILALIAEDPPGLPLLLAGGLVLVTLGRILQALILRSILDLGRDLGSVKQRALGMLVLAAVALVLVLVQAPITLGLSGIGRRLEVRLRQAYFEKLPRTEDRYFQSRLASDMASRCHAIQSMRTLPGLVAQSLAIALEVIATAGALVWVAPAEWKVILTLAATTLFFPWLAQALFFEPDMRIQTHSGALSGFILDGLLGLVPLRVHGAERALRRAQETLLVQWTRARYALQSFTVAFEGLQAVVSYGLVVLLVFSYLRSDRKASLVLLLVFWALRFPTLGQRLLALTRSVPSVMNRARRLLEMIGNVAPESRVVEAGVPERAPSRLARSGGVALSFAGVRVKGGGHVILDKVSLEIAPGEHVAVVGPSGAGKSTLVGLLLGWLRPVRGEIRVDGELLDQSLVEDLRRRSAWVDPAINLWNRSLLENLRYGNDSSRAWALGAALEGADMLDILEALPDGLQTQLGEGGGLVSGGQGQRVRLARAMLRTDVRLAILDEPFRGLDRERRARLLGESRRLWADITLLCVTHDVAQTREFDRVLVVEGGRIVESAPPAELLANPESRYAQLVRADEENHRLLWRGATWRRWWLADGHLDEKSAA